MRTVNTIPKTTEPSTVSVSSVESGVVKNHKKVLSSRFVSNLKKASEKREKLTDEKILATQLVTQAILPALR